MGAIHRGLGDALSDCVGGNADACKVYYSTVYANDPSVLAAQSGINTLPQAQDAALSVTAQNAPPVYLTPDVFSTDPSVYGDATKYDAALAAASGAQQANDQNGRLFSMYVNAYANWLYGGSVGPVPQPPVYVTPQDYGVPSNAEIGVAPAGTPIPASGYDLPGAGASSAIGTPFYSGPVVSVPGIYSPSTASTSSSPAIIPTRSPTISQQQLAQATNAAPVAIMSASGGGNPQVSSGFDFGSFMQESTVGGIPNWALVAGVVGVIVLMGMKK